MSETVHTLVNQGNDPGIEGDFPLDRSVTSHFPEGTKVLSANRHGPSAWTVTARIATEHSDGALQEYFLKCATEEAGHSMMEGEFWAMTELYRTIPDHIPKPIARGKYENSNIPPTYYFLCEFVDMDNQTPDPEVLCAAIVELHRKSVSPTGKFGFHVRTCNGRTPQATEWDSSWTSFFAKLMKNVLEDDFRTNGVWFEMQQLGQRIVDVVIPRLIGALEAEGRSIKPSLIHADLWEGNTGLSYATGAIMLFDAGSYYAHNEMEIGDWRCPYNKVNAKIYTKTYLRHFGKSEPTEEWDDRNRMYSVYYDVIYSVNHMLQGRAVRQM